MRIHTAVRTGLVALCAASVAAAPTLAGTTANAAQHVRSTQAPLAAAAQESAQQAAASTLRFKVGSKSLKVRGAAGLRAGHVRVKVSGRTRGHTTVAVARFSDGYRFADLRKDYRKANRGDMKALKRVIAKVDFLGGFAVGARRTTGTIRLPARGTYTAYTIGARGPATPVTLRAGGVRRGGAPKVDATIKAKRGHRWGGSAHLPAEGTLKLDNRAEAPHFLYLVQVVEGTTVEQVMEALQSDEEPTWILEGALETDVVSPRRSMTVDYDLPPGQYVALCFFPDPKMKGMPHAMMGMVRMFHLM